MLESRPMAPPFALPPSPAPARRGWASRVRAFLLERWAGRLLLGALVLAGLGAVGLAVPLLTPTARVVVWAYAIFGCIRLVALVLRRLLWRIRTKLIFSYLFIALVPVVLLTLFFFIAS